MAPLPPDSPPVWIRLPLNMPSGSKAQGCVVRLRAAMYGLRESPRLFILHLRKLLKERGWEFISDGLFVLNVQDSIKCMGHDMQMSEGKVLVTLSTYLAKIPRTLLSVCTSFTVRDLEPPEPEEVNPELKPEMQSVPGTLGCATTLCPGVAYVYGELSRWTDTPTQRHLIAVKKVLRDLVQSPPHELQYRQLGAVLSSAYTQMLLTVDAHMWDA
eukprot:GHVR01151045.1.p1 GENE.GHVR01151045.1~~GHVR01151045.1.p1  ORF type:complete len:214 (+),score=26.77 GHVR01151045.1:232-873(+)